MLPIAMVGAASLLTAQNNNSLASALGMSQSPFPTYIPSNPPTYEPGWVPEEIARVQIRKINNGYIVVFQKTLGSLTEQYFAADLKEVGERITACCVANVLKGQETTGTAGG